MSFGTRNKFHDDIGAIFNNHYKSCEVIKDKACGGKQNIPLFCSDLKSNETEFANVDLLLIRNGKIKIIIEIDEANRKPNHIIGKFFCAALTQNYNHRTTNGEKIPMDDEVMFMQIISTKKLKTMETSKFEQWKNIEKRIRETIPLHDSKVKKYSLIFSKSNDINEIESRINQAINEFLT